MQQYFIEGNYQVQDKVKLNKEQSHHILHVLRMKTGDVIRIANNQELIFLAHIEMVGNEVFACLDEQLDTLPSTLHITLAQALIKGERWDYALQKACELGVHTIQPIMTKRCVVKVSDEKSDKKRQRWNKIALEACEQCKRSSLVSVGNILDLKELMKQEYDVKLLAYEQANHTTMKLKDTLANVSDTSSILCIVGPEGGFDEEEVNYLLEHGCICVSLGSRILRAETAAQAMVHAITYTFDC